MALLWPLTSVGGGTLEFAQVEQLLREQPATYRWLATTLVFPSAAYAEIRLGTHFPALGGARIGPYSFFAERRGAGPASRVEVTLCTRYRFLDPQGVELPEGEIEKATKIDEHLLAILVRDPQTNMNRSLCPQ
jgi:hypothetical protein